MKNILIFLLLFFVFGLGYSQNPTLSWVTAIGTPSAQSHGKAIYVDPSGNVFSSGDFKGITDFDTGPSVFTLSASSAGDIFILKQDNSGNFIWAKGFTGIGGGSESSGLSILTDPTGNIYLTGIFQGIVDFDPGASSYTLASNGNQDIFILKLDPNGNFIWAKGMGNMGSDGGSKLVLDASGNILCVGSFQGTVDFDPNVGTYNLTVGNLGAFVLKLTSSGNFIFAKSFDSASGSSMVLDASGNIYCTGYFEGTADFDPSAGTYSLTTIANRDVYALKLNSAGNFVWAKNISCSSGYPFGYDIKLDPTGNVYLSGSISGTADFDPGVGQYTVTATALWDIFVLKLDNSGNFIWAKTCNSGFGLSLQLDNANNIYVSGYYTGSPTDFDPGIGTYTLATVFSADIFVLKLSDQGNFIWAVDMGGGCQQIAYAMALDQLSNIYTTGEFSALTDFDPNAGNTNTPLVGWEDIFIHKLSQGFTADINEHKLHDNAILFPNPNKGSFIIQIENEIENGEIILINSLGQKVYEQKVKQGQNNIITHNLSSGLYSFIILRDKGQISNGKLTVE